VAAASDARKYDGVPPLQDNFALVARRWAKHNSPFRALVSWHWAHIANLLIAWLIIPFSVLWEQVRRSRCLRLSLCELQAARLCASLL